MNKFQNLICVVLLAIALTIVVLAMLGKIVIGSLILALYLIIFFLVWLLLSTNMLRAQMNKFRIIQTNGGIKSICTLIKRTIALKSFFKDDELLDFYYYAASCPTISREEKNRLYQVMTHIGYTVHAPSDISQQRKNSKKGRK